MANNFRIRKSLKRQEGSEERAKSGKRCQRMDTMDSYLAIERRG